jgi:hypothetical protein
LRQELQQAIHAPALHAPPRLTATPHAAPAPPTPPLEPLVGLGLSEC